jgi:RNA polymerase sigma factor (sigma-70 family)
MDRATLLPMPEADVALLRDNLRLLAVRWLGRDDLAEDAAQETILRMLTAWRDAPWTQRQPIPYAVGVLHHVVADMWRLAAREAQLAPGNSVPSPSSSPLEQLLARETGSDVRHAWMELSTADRLLLFRCFVEGRHVSEIARETAEPAGRLRQRKLRALHRLRTVLASTTSAPESD